MSKQFAVIGLGRFGSSVARTLVDNGAEVLAIDKDEQPVQDALAYTDQAVRLDATDPKALDQVGIEDFDAVIVCMEDMQAAVMISLLCIEKDVPRVITKAKTDLQADLLKRIGVQECVFPERQAGYHLAQKLLSSDILESITMSDDYGTAELNAHPSWVGRTLLELGFRQQYGLNVIALRHRNASVNINPEAADQILDDDKIFVIGSVDDIKAIQKVLAKEGKL